MFSFLLKSGAGFHVTYAQKKSNIMYRCPRSLGLQDRVYVFSFNFNFISTGVQYTTITFNIGACT